MKVEILTSLKTSGAKKQSETKSKKNLIKTKEIIEEQKPGILSVIRC